MTGLEIWLLAIGLAMDCFAVSIASGIILKRIQWRPMLVMALAFGLFQALMPFIGWMFAKTFSHLIESVDHWIAFAILAFLLKTRTAVRHLTPQARKSYSQWR